jgi:hypothetical protein
MSALHSQSGIREYHGGSYDFAATKGALKALHPLYLASDKSVTWERFVQLHNRLTELRSYSGPSLEWARGEAERVAGVLRAMNGLGDDQAFSPEGC